MPGKLNRRKTKPQLKPFASAKHCNVAQTTWVDSGVTGGARRQQCSSADRESRSVQVERVSRVPAPASAPVVAPVIQPTPPRQPPPPKRSPISRGCTAGPSLFKIATSRCDAGSSIESNRDPQGGAEAPGVDRLPNLPAGANLSGLRHATASGSVRNMDPCAAAAGVYSLKI